jgi:hypothetical protein
LWRSKRDKIRWEQCWAVGTEVGSKESTKKGEREEVGERSQSRTLILTLRIRDEIRCPMLLNESKERFLDEPESK